MSDLPTGVSVEGTPQIPAGKNSANVVLKAAENAAVVATPLRIVGRATEGDMTLERRAEAPASGNLCPRSTADRSIDVAMLAVTMKPPYTVELIDKNRQRAVHRGTTYPAPFVITRTR